MNIQKVKGEYKPCDALDILSKMIHQKIKYQENSISKNSSEEEIKFRESKIKQFQNELFELSGYLNASNKKMEIEAIFRME